MRLAFVLAVALTSASPALAGPVALRPMTAAPAEQQAVSQLKGGAICLKQGPTTASEMRHAIEGGGFDARLREELSKAGVALDGAGSAAVAVAGVARVSLVDVCLPDWGFDKVDKIGGKVEVAVDWTLSDRASGAELGRLSTRELLEQKAGPGGLSGMVLEAFAGNARALAANAAFRQAASRPALSVPKAEPAVLRDPARLVLEPWRRTTWKAPRAIAIPQIIESDLDKLDSGGGGLFAHEYFAVQIDAGETLKLQVLDASKRLNLSIADAKPRYVAVTTPKQPERQLSAVLPKAGTYIVEVWWYGDPPNTAYQLQVETDRRPYVKPEPQKRPEPSEAETAPSPAQARTAPARRSPRPPFAPPVFVK
jgi:hypothetical protein